MGGTCYSWLAIDWRHEPPTDSSTADPDSDLRAARIALMAVDLLLVDLAPYFVVFSAAVMLVTKRSCRKDQTKQMDNTWKACGVDAAAARQLQTAFIVLAVGHSMLLFPRVAYRTFLFVVDPQIAGGSMLFQSATLRSAVSLSRTVCALLQYVFIATKFAVLVAVSPSFRRQCAVAAACRRRCCCCCFRSPSSPDGAAETAAGNDGRAVTGGGGGPGDHVTDQPLLERPAAATKLDSTGAGLTSTTLIVENGAPCIKIFSMTSV